MNRLLSYLLFFSSVFCIAQNKGFIFELKHHPNSEYLSEFEKSTKFKVEKKADKETLKYFDSLGVKRFQKGNKKETYSVSTKTKEQKGNQTIPIEILAYDFNFKGTLNKEKVKETFKIKSLQAKGYVNLENNLTINELLVDNKPSQKENEFIRNIENREFGINFPEHKIGIGETVSFEHTIYYKVPLEGDNLYSVNCIATLVKVKKGIAHFKISSDQQTENWNYELTVKGVVKFDIENYFTNYICLESTLHIDEVIDDGIIFEHNYSEKNKIKTELKNTSW
ncbi:hypothetical protein [Hanstruepera marina]|uniref:hypothetical protein n=1 Tax=Hanstruepera marina TaxID=2873265 RepID=UPI001CA70478|nr:hypothetical protein [Hanstruepera marina]